MRFRVYRAVLLSLSILTSGGCLFSATTDPEELDPCAQDERVVSGECVACEAGTTRAAGDDPAGSDTSCQDVVEELDPCAQDEHVVSGECVACEAGTTNEEGDDPTGADTSCQDIVCGDDERVEGNACVRCEPGARREAGDIARGGDTVCEPRLCMEDESVRANRCEPCPDGETNMAGDEASGEDTSCDDLCPPNHFVSGFECVMCEPGFTRPPGDDPNGADTECAPRLCRANESVAGNACVPCPMGTSNEEGDDASGENTSCTPIRCNENERVESKRCVACVPGATRQPGDDASGVNTSCEVTECAEDQYVSSNTCMDCAPGSTRPPGDDATGDDTACAPTACLEDQYVSRNSCEDCAPGTERDAGDLATGGDTVCASTPCLADQYVSGNACVACPMGETNAQGDDASGGDTLCDDSCVLAVGVRCDAFAEAYIKSSNTDVEDAFGFSVDMDGDTLVVGAHLEDSGATGVGGDELNDLRPSAGAAYVFVRNGTTWSQQAYLKSPTSTGGLLFGWSVAVRGDTVVVGARREFSDATGVDGVAVGAVVGAGAAFVFERTGTTWAQTAYLKASNTSENDEFGHAVDTDGQLIVVGARYESNSATGVDPATDDELASRSGAAYVFRRSPMGMGPAWVFDAYLKASNTGAGDQFGYDVSVDAGVVAVGARFEQSISAIDSADDSADEAGAVYVFEQLMGAWVESAYLKSSNIGAGDKFGFSLDLDGDRLVVGAYHEDSGDPADLANDSVTNAGAAYVFERSMGAWGQVAYLKHPDPNNFDEFGFSVALDGDLVVVGAYAEDALGAGLNPDPAADFTSNGTAGAVALFERQANGLWTSKAFIKPPNPTQGNRFGYAVAISGSRLASADYFEDSSATGINGNPFDTQAPDSGAVFVRRVAP